MKTIPRTLNYYAQIFYLIECISNWPLIVVSRFFPFLSYDLRLRSGQTFKIDHFLSALTLKEVFYDGDYRPKTKSARTIVDIGANIGTCTIYMSSLFPKAKVYSFEPDPNTFKLLKTNVEKNNQSNITLVNQAVSNHSGHTTFYSCQASGLSSLSKTMLPYKVTKTQVILTTIPELMKKFDIKTIDVLKIDAEGAEFDILLKTPRFPFQSIKEIILEYHDRLTSHYHEELVNKLHQVGYKLITRPHPLEEGIGIIQAYR